MNPSGSDVAFAFVAIQLNPYLSRRDFSLSCSLEMVSRHLVSSWRRSTTSERKASTSSSLVPDPGAWPFCNDLCELPRPFSVSRNISGEICRANRIHLRMKIVSGWSQTRVSDSHRRYFEQYQGVKNFTSVTHWTVYARWDWTEHQKTHKISKFLMFNVIPSGLNLISRNIIFLMSCGKKFPKNLTQNRL